MLIVGSLRATNRRASDGDEAHGPQVRVVSKATARSRLSHIPRPMRNAAPRWKVKRPLRVSSLLRPKAPSGPRSAGLWPECRRCVARSARGKRCSVGQAPKWPRGLQPGASATWLRGLPMVHGVEGLESNRPRPLSCRAKSPAAADPILPGWTWSRCRGSRERLKCTARRRPSVWRAIRISLRARAVRSPVDSGTYPGLGPLP